MLFHVQRQGFPFEIPGSKRRIQVGNKVITESDYEANLINVGSVDAIDGREAIRAARECGLSLHPIVWPYTAMEETAFHLKQKGIHVG